MVQKGVRAIEVLLYLMILLHFKNVNPVNTFVRSWTETTIKAFYFIPSSEFNAYLKQIKVLFSAGKKYRIFSLVTNTIYIFSP